MRRSIYLALLTALVLAGPGTALADHDYPGFTEAVPLPADVNSGGGEWETIATFPTGNPQTDLDFFTQGGEMFVAVGTLGAGLNAGGQTIVQLTEDGEVSPSFVAGHPSASCITDESAALGLQHDVEATPKGEVFLNAANPFADRSDAQLLIDATDATGRCHDNGTLGFAGVPQGGLEIIDITDIGDPVEIALTSHIGEAHTTNVDPKRPHIVYSVTSDAVSVAVDEDDVDGDGDTEELIRQNEVEGSSDAMDLDGFEVLDISSCMDFPEGTSVEDKRAQCRPEVYRFRYPTLEMSLGHTNLGTVYACHELELYADDTLTCASGGSLLVFDMSDAFEDNGTPDDYSDDTPRGDPLPCAVRESTSAETPTDAPIIDCVVGEEGSDLTVPAWLDMGAPSLEGVEYVGRVVHMGRETTSGAFTPAFPSFEDIDFNHETELTHSGDFVIATDERGGGVTPPGATCEPGVDNPNGNGGIHAYRVSELRTDYTDDPTEAFDAYALTPQGEKAIHRAEIHTGPQASLCTAHVFQQVPGQNRIFMGWYSQGTQVVDYVEHPDGTFEWLPVAYWIPVDANQWTSHVFQMEENDDRTWTYWGAAADFELGTAGRSSIEVYKVTLPPPAQFAPTAAAPGDEPTTPPAPPPAPPAPPPAPSPLPTTGGGIALAAVAVLGGAAAFGRRRRE